MFLCQILYELDDSMQSCIAFIKRMPESNPHAVEQMAAYLCIKLALTTFSYLTGYNRVDDFNFIGQHYCLGATNVDIVTKILMLCYKITKST